MTPIKFEENIKDKLEQRELQPASDAWQKLSDRLDAEPQKRSRGAYWWLGIAASFIGLLIISSIFFLNGSDNEVNTPILVNEEIQDAVENNMVVEDTSVEAGQIASEVPDQVIGEIQKQVLKPENIITKTQSEEIIVAQLEKQQENTNESIVHQEKPIENKSVVSKTVEALKVDEVVARIQKLQKEKTVVSDAEIDALLAQAEKDLLSQRLRDASTKTVDADLLLLQVETDLDQSFRDRVFEALKSGYKKVKTAVAERNQ